MMELYMAMESWLSKMEKCTKDSSKKTNTVEMVCRHSQMALSMAVSLLKESERAMDPSSTATGTVTRVNSTEVNPQVLENSNGQTVGFI
jgi:hypothetical protein